jgi:hypothetical protein
MGRSTNLTRVARGGILQVVYQQVSGSTVALTADGDVLTASITPTSTSSKILIMAQTHGDRSTGTSSDYVNQNIRRATTDLITFGQGIGFLIANGQRWSASGIFLDSPGTTSAVSYRIYNDVLTGSATFNYYVGGTSITLMEIAA